MSTKPLPPELIDAFRAELRIVAVMGLVAGALLAGGGALFGVAIAMSMRGPEALLLVVAIALFGGGMCALSGGRRLWKQIRDGDVTERSLSWLTVGLMIGGVPGILLVVSFAKSWEVWRLRFALEDLGLLVIWLLPLILAAYAGFVGMRIRIALRGFERS